GVTWVTSRTVRPACAAISLSRAAATRAAVAAKLSPPPVGSASGADSQALRSSGWRSRTSPKVRPSQAPKSVSRSPSSICTSSPRRAATICAVSRVRASGAASTACTVPRRARSAATRSACSRSMPERAGAPPPLPEKRFCGVSGVSPCRSRTKVAGGPMSAGPQPERGVATASAARTSAPAFPASDVGSVPDCPASEAGPGPAFPASDAGSVPAFPVSEAGSVPAFPASDTGPGPAFPTSDTGPGPAFPTSDAGPVPAFPASDTGPGPACPASDAGPVPDAGWAVSAGLSLRRSGAAGVSAWAAVVGGGRAVAGRTLGECRAGPGRSGRGVPGRALRLGGRRAHGAGRRGVQVGGGRRRGPLLPACARVHRLVGQPVGVLVALARDPLVGDPLPREDPRRLGRQRLHVGVLDLPAAGHLLDDQLGVHPDADHGLRVEVAGGAQAGQQAPVLGDVVGGDADVLGGLRQGLPRRRVAHHGPVPGGPGVAPRPAVRLDDELPHR